MADEELEHPALKNFNEGVYTAKHVAGKTAKGALIGTAIGAVGLPLAAGAFAFLASGPLAPVLGGIALFTDLGAAALTTTVAYGAIGGAAAGGATGLATSISSVDEAVANRKEEIVAQADKMEMRVQKREALEMQRNNMHAAAEAQAASLHVAPPQALPIKPMDGQLLG